MEHNIDILLVEDNHDEAELTIRSFKKHNLANKLVHIDDGEEALDFIFSKGKYESNVVIQRPRLIVLDLKLPKIDGLEILRQIKLDPRTRTIPVVILTSSREDKDIIESYKLGTNAYVTKPVSFDSFTKAVADLGLFWMVINEAPKL